jgi:GH24 family phage-related lysozyme (muramidase)
MNFDDKIELYLDMLEEGKLRNLGFGALAAATALTGGNIKAQDVRKEVTPIVKNKIDKAVDIGAFLVKAKDYIKKNEGEKLYLYDDKHPNRKWKIGDKLDGNLTIGVGHLVKPEEIEKYRNGIDVKQMQNLFNSDAVEHLKRAIELFPKYWSYPDDVKIALLDGVFRGEHEKGHDTVEYINNGVWDKVPNEYINRKDYKNAVANGLPGLITRMNRNKQIFQRMADGEWDNAKAEYKDREDYQKSKE